MSSDLPAVMTTRQLGEILNVSPDSLAQDRYYGRGVPFVKIGAKRVRYLREDVLNYLQANRMRRTDDIRGTDDGWPDQPPVTRSDNSRGSA